MSIQTNATAVGLRLRQADEGVRDALRTEGYTQAQRLASEMRRRAPKGVRTTLANSIVVQEPGPYEFIIKPTAAYAPNVERGRKPGKGLPRFFDPASASAVAWLEGMLGAARRAINPAWRKGRTGTGRGAAEELDLRDRYFMWSRAVKARGIKASPFVKPTAEALGPSVNAALQAALARALGRKGRGAA